MRTTPRRDLTQCGCALSQSWCGHRPRLASLRQQRCREWLGLSAVHPFKYSDWFGLASGTRPSLAARGDSSHGLTPRQYARLVHEWVASIGRDPAKFGMHSLRCTKAVLIYRRTGNLRAVQLLLGHSKIESTVRNLGIEVDDAIEIAEKIDI